MISAGRLPGIVARLAGGAHPRRTLVRAPIGFEPGLGAGLDADQIRPHVPNDAVQRELGPIAAPLTETEQGVADVQRLSIDDDRRAQHVQMRSIRPPEVRGFPAAGN